MHTTALFYALPYVLFHLHTSGNKNVTLLVTLCFPHKCTWWNDHDGQANVIPKAYMILCDYTYEHGSLNDIVEVSKTTLCPSSKLGIMSPAVDCVLHCD